jgi:hypothetical protein
LFSYFSDWVSYFGSGIGLYWWSSYLCLPVDEITSMHHHVCWNGGLIIFLPRLASNYAHHYRRCITTFLSLHALPSVALPSLWCPLPQDFTWDWKMELTNPGLSASKTVSWILYLQNTCSRVFSYSNRQQTKARLMYWFVQ